MKTFSTLILLIFSASVMALTKSDVEKLLREKNLSLKQFESEAIILGEVTGAGKSLPMHKVSVVLTDNEAILSQEIVDLSFKNDISKIGHLDQLRTRTSIVELKDIKGLIHSR